MSKHFSSTLIKQQTYPSNLDITEDFEVGFHPKSHVILHVQQHFLLFSLNIAHTYVLRTLHVRYVHVHKRAYLGQIDEIGICLFDFWEKRCMRDSIVDFCLG